MSLVDEDDHGGTRDVAQGSKLVLRTGVDSREEVREGDRWVFTVCTCALSVLGERGSRGLRREGRDLLVGHADEEIVEGPYQVVAWFSSCDVYTTSPFMSTKKDCGPRSL